MYCTFSLILKCLLIALCLERFHQICTLQGESMSRQRRWRLRSNQQYRLSIMLSDLNIIRSFSSLQQIENSLMSWYNTYSDTTKRLDQLIDSNPTLQQLLQYPEFLQLLRAYQPKLLQYITNSPDIPHDLIRYITEPPLQSDSQSRKYKLPLLTMLTIQTNTICVINSFFKIEPNLQKTYFIVSFYEFLGSDQELLPLLCGYFSQFNLILWNNRYKEVVDLIYQAKEPLFLLVKHSYSKAIINTLLLYLNLDLTRNNNSPPERLTLKLQIIRLLLEQLRDSFERAKKDKQQGKYQTIIQNIGQVLVQIIQKYYLISDGKNMLQIITSLQNVALIIEIFMQGGSIALSVSNIVGWLMRYYCLSSFNTEDPQNAQLSKRNQQRLQAQPFPKIIIELIPKVAQIVDNSTTLTLYHSKLIQIFNMSLELSSRKVIEAVKKSKYIQILISLFSRYPHLNIIHKMIEKLFYQIFNSDRSVFQQYRKYLFCQGNLIQTTVGIYLSKIKDLNKFKLTINNLHQGYFSYLMRIIKIYSKVQTNDQDINKSIVDSASMWQNFSTFILQPYEALCFKDLGSYDNAIEKPPVQYTIKCITGGINNNQIVSKKVLQEIHQEESMQKFKTQQSQKPAEEKTNGGLSEDNLFNVQQFNAPQKQDKKNQFETNISMPHNVSPDTFQHKLAPNPSIQIQISSPNVIINHINPPDSPAIVEPKILQQPQPINRKYEQFLNSKKQQVDKQINLQRKNSSEKRLSANKSRVTSPSPKKKRWEDTPQDQQKVVPAKLVPAPKLVEPEGKKQKISLTTPAMRPPMIPHSKIIQSHVSSPPPANLQSKSEIKNNNQVIVKVSQPKAEQIKTIQNISDNVNSSISFEPKSQSFELNQPESKKLNDQRSISASQLVQRTVLQNSKILSKSAINLNDLKNIQFRKERVLKPQKSQYRKIQEKDRILLDFLGVKY